MDARYIRTALIAVVLLASTGAAYRTKNFVVNAPDARLAAEVAQAAEKYRRDLAVSWLGEPMRDWASPCVTTVRVGQHMGSGGATTFMFDRGEVYGWRMSIQGSRQRLLDSVLPHEITHTILATHFRRPLPRWADEGAATSVEHISERKKYYQMLHKFLRNGRGIAFGDMFKMTEYPADVMPLYSQGFTLADFLIRQGGRRKYIAFVEDGLESGNWPQAITRNYNWRTVGELQNGWLAWVAKGCPSLEIEKNTPPNDTLLAANVGPIARGGLDPNGNATQVDTSPMKFVSSPRQLPRPQPNLIYHIPAANPQRHASAAENRVPLARETVPVVKPINTQSARPQGIEKSRQIILEWRNR